MPVPDSATLLGRRRPRTRVLEASADSGAWDPGTCYPPAFPELPSTRARPECLAAPVRGRSFLLTLACVPLLHPHLLCPALCFPQFCISDRSPFHLITSTLGFPPDPGVPEAVTSPSAPRSPYRRLLWLPRHPRSPYPRHLTSPPTPTRPLPPRGPQVPSAGRWGRGATVAQSEWLSPSSGLAPQQAHSPPGCACTAWSSHDEPPEPRLPACTRALLPSYEGNRRLQRRGRDRGYTESIVLSFIPFTNQPAKLY